MTTTGRLIVLSGIDGSGKATQAGLLQQRIRDAGGDAEIVDFPRYGSNIFADMVSAYLRGEYGPADNVDAHLASLMYAGDRWTARPAIEQWLAEGTVVVCNRYVCANQAHQGGKIADADARREFYAWVEHLEFEVFAMPRPDLTILLHVPPEVAQRLVDAKGHREYIGGSRRDAHETSAGHLLNAAQAHLELCESRPHWVRVDCVRDGDLLSREEIAEKVWVHVTPLLSSS